VNTPSYSHVPQYLTSLSGFLSRGKNKDDKEPEKPKAAKSSIPNKVRPEEDGDGRSSDQPILIPSGIEELDDDE
jgi:hypothetical protein